MQSTPKDSKLIPGWSPNNFSDPHLLDRQGTYDEKSFQNIYLILSLWPKTVESIYIYTVYIYVCHKDIFSSLHIITALVHSAKWGLQQFLPRFCCQDLLQHAQVIPAPAKLTNAWSVYKRKTYDIYIYIYICISKYIYETIYIYIYTLYNHKLRLFM